MDGLCILRQGGAWRINSFSSEAQWHIVSVFHLLARERGSNVLWLAQSGTLCSADPEENRRAFPYEAWATEAMAFVGQQLAV